MFPLTEDKFLLDFLGKTLLERQVDTVRHRPRILAKSVTVK
jgi:hypothetical protein